MEGNKDNRKDKKDEREKETDAEADAEADADDERGLKRRRTKHNIERKQHSFKSKRFGCLKLQNPTLPPPLQDLSLRLEGRSEARSMGCRVRELQVGTKSLVSTSQFVRGCCEFKGPIRGWG